MSHTRLEHCHECPLKVSKFCFVPEKLGGMVILLIMFGILVCLVASISLAPHSAFSKPDRWFPLPEHILAVQKNTSVIHSGPTNISHLQFGIAGSANTWHDRSNYTKLWWNPNTTRGFVWLDKKPKILHSDMLVPPYQISRGWTRFKYLHSASAVRIARIVYESFKLGLPNVRENGFHQFDIRGNPYGFLAAHPLVPLVSLHHLDQLSSLFPNQTQINSMKKLISAYHIDPARIVQQIICYDHKRGWSISISWGYTIQIYTALLIAADLQMPLQTFQTWRSSMNGPFIFNTRPMSSDPCQQPTMFFLDQATKVGKSGSITIYKRHEGNESKCLRSGTNNLELQRIRVTALKLDPEYWKNVPRRHCCQLLGGGSIKNGSMDIRIKKCRSHETITI
ncbi:hypothetical protein GLYMA_11G221600v4 [Glycine max]|nr:hypothetical protein GLYMA_11G221600v4 [Glycine max]KAH1160303.1 hypothetical protein GYH30_031873 [Glycine max]